MFKNETINRKGSGDVISDGMNPKKKNTAGVPNNEVSHLIYKFN